MRISDWSSDVCSSDLLADGGVELHRHRLQVRQIRVENLAVEDEADIAQCRFGQAETGFALDGHGGGDRDGRSRLAVDPEGEADRRQFLERYILGQTVYHVKTTGRNVERERKSGGEGKRWSGRVESGGRRNNKKKKKN